jgi:hypothetical protein
MVFGRMHKAMPSFFHDGNSNWGTVLPCWSKAGNVRMSLSAYNCPRHVLVESRTKVMEIKLAFNASARVNLKYY